ncbi:hypothetical protein PVAP13_6NG246803 [Panicum virgatum]|uniref:Uncharacterized protein n=1 Tax=Panicum virgatum TaxID=38727 RepID=A0A8T0R177_PANVG|nr:hypothetical protein PVAP13_6NG246803 [Panicum virgatum]
MEQASCDRGGAEASGWGGPPYLEKQSRCKCQVVAMATESRRNPRRCRCSAPIVAAALLRPAAARRPLAPAARAHLATRASPRAGRSRRPPVPRRHQRRGREGGAVLRAAQRPRPWIRPPLAEPRPRSRIHPRGPAGDWGAPGLRAHRRGHAGGFTAGQPSAAVERRTRSASARAAGEAGAGMAGERGAERWERERESATWEPG